MQDQCNYDEIASDTNNLDDNEDEKEEGSDYEDELREQVGELPPKIEDIMIEDYEEGETEEEEDENNEAPTVVIDSSLDEKEIEKYRQMIEGNDEESKEGVTCIREYEKQIEPTKGDKGGYSNIQAALKSIQM